MDATGHCARGTSLSFTVDTVDTIAFDSSGTLVDVMAVESILAEDVGEPETVGELEWEPKMLDSVVDHAELDDLTEQLSV